MITIMKSYESCAKYSPQLVAMKTLAAVNARAEASESKCECECDACIYYFHVVTFYLQKSNQIYVGTYSYKQRFTVLTQDAQCSLALAGIIPKSLVDFMKYFMVYARYVVGPFDFN